MGTTFLLEEEPRPRRPSPGGGAPPAAKLTLTLQWTRPHTSSMEACRAPLLWFLDVGEDAGWDSSPL